ncbi:MAG: CRISPR-associated endonuclease Cas2 [Eubacterium sp.]|nr:CRISPR-associated endonuclease Cas2 [Eubacterium sp.]
MYLVSYDISSDKRRRKIAKELENYGKRVQYSVFECNISKGKYKKMYAKLLNLMDGDEDGNIRIYELCGVCIQKVVTMGIYDDKGDLDEEEVVVI